MKLVLLAILLFSSLSYARRDIAPFTSDGCSSWIEGPLTDTDLWKTCCFEHDISYWMGGTEHERVVADQTLRDCVGERHDMLMGWMMYTGVRVGGGPGYNTPYRWGYGWNYSRPYRALNSTEKKVVANELDRSCFAGEEAGIIYNYMLRKKLPMSYMKLIRR